MSQIDSTKCNKKRTKKNSDNDKSFMLLLMRSANAFYSMQEPLRLQMRQLRDHLGKKEKSGLIIEAEHRLVWDA